MSLKYLMNLKTYLQNNSKKYLVFDFDLTLVELLIPWHIVINRTREYFESINPILAKECEDFGYEGYNKMIKKYGSEVKKTIDKLYLEDETHKSREVRLNHEALNFISSNQGKYNFYVWSNNQRTTLEEILKENNLNNLFKSTVSGTDVKLFKPDPEGFYRLYDTSQNKKDYLMIGDSENDKKAAENSGIDYLYLHI